MDHSKKLCPLPWVHLSYHTDGFQRACCHTESTEYNTNDSGNILHQENIGSALNTQFLKDIRLKMLRDEEPNVCRGCFSAEQEFGASARLKYRNIYHDQLEGLLEGTDESGEAKPELVNWIDFSFGNLCNLSCEMCGPDYSSKLQGKIKGPVSDKVTERLKRINSFTATDKTSKLKVLHNVKKIAFQGGEPLLSKGHKPLLRSLLESGKTEYIEYNTNLTFLDEEVISLWKEFKSVKLYISLDEVGESASRIRKGINWDNFDSNIKKIIKNRIEFSFVTTIQALNVLRLPKILSYLKNEYGLNHCPDFIPIVSPGFLSISSIRSSEIDYVLSELKGESYFESGNDSLENLISFLESHQYNEENAFRYQVYLKRNS